MNPSTIRDGLASRLATISGLQVYDTMPASVNVPCAFVLPDSPAVFVHGTMGHGFCDVRFTVTVLVQLADWPSAQDALDAYVATGTSETSSVVEALEATAVAVGGGAQQVVVMEIGDYGTTEIGTDTYGSVVFNVRVPASRA